MMSKSMIKIICIVLAGLMLLSSVAVLTQVFAAEAIPVTGDNDMRLILPVVIVALALLVVIICVILPKIKKKDGE